VLWFAGLLLLGILRGPLRHASTTVRKSVRFLLVFVFSLGFLLLLVWQPILRGTKQTSGFTALWILALGLTPIAWLISVVRIFRPERKQEFRKTPASFCAPTPFPETKTPSHEVPRLSFADLGGMDDAKDQIRQMVEAQLKPERSKRYGLSRNGILLYGPRGTGKTLLARAAAGEFGLNLVYVSAPKLLNRWIGRQARTFTRHLQTRPPGNPLFFSPTRSTRLVQDGRMLWGIQAAPDGNSTTSPWH
jgi:uncharacterized membrane protein (DUF485 family)